MSNEEQEKISKIISEVLGVSAVSYAIIATDGRLVNFKIAGDWIRISGLVSWFSTYLNSNIMKTKSLDVNGPRTIDRPQDLN